MHFLSSEDSQTFNATDIQFLKGDFQLAKVSNTCDFRTHVVSARDATRYVPTYKTGVTDRLFAKKQSVARGQFKYIFRRRAYPASIFY